MFIYYIWVGSDVQRVSILHVMCVSVLLLFSKSWQEKYDNET